MKKTTPTLDSMRVELETWMRSLPNETPLELAKAYHGGKESTLTFLGLKVPTIQSALKAPLAVNALSENRAAETWLHIWQTSLVYEVMCVALYWFISKKNYAAALTHWPYFVKMVERIENWPHSDSLSKLVARCLECDPKTVYPVILKWNKSKNPWKQRQSLVGLLYYSASREVILPFAKMMPLVEKHAENEDFYVQKAVGWTLREIGNVYPKETYDWLKKNIRRLSAYAFSASTEKISPEKKRLLKEKRLHEKKR
jgi:3-methyladenine DNA glycosylase AlkD